MAATATSQPAANPAPHGAGQATIYFIRPKVLTLAAFTSTALLVDGRKIGALSSSAYFVVKEPAGHHVLEMQGGDIFGSSWQSEIDLAPGQTYYPQIAPRLTGGVGLDIMNMIIAGTSFHQLGGHGQQGFGFFLLDADQSRAKLSGLTNASR